MFVQKSKNYQFIFLIVVPLTSLILALVLWKITDNYSAKKAKFHIDDHIEGFIENVNTRLAIYETTVKGARGLFSASKSVEKEEWTEYIKALNIFRNYPGMKMMGYIEKNALVYLEPSNLNEDYWFGRDFGANQLLQIRMQESINQNKLIACPYDGWFLIIAPVYKNEAPLRTELERKQAHSGFVLAALNIFDLIDSVFEVEKTDVVVQIYDGINPTEENLIYQSKELSAEKAESLNTHFNYAYSFLGNTWTIRFYPNRFCIKNHLSERSFIPTLVLLSGLILTTLLSLVIWALFRRRNEAQKLAEKMTRDYQASEARLLAINEASPLGIFATDESGKYVYTNKMHQKISGLSLEEVRGKDWLKSVYFEDEDFVSEAWNESLERKNFFHLQFRFRKSDDSIIWVNAQAAPIKGEAGGSASGFVGLIEDITLSKQKDDLLKSETEYTRAVMDASPALIVSLDLNGEVKYINKYCQEIIGFANEEITSQNWWKLLYPGEFRERVKKFQEDFSSEEALLNYEMSLKSKSGEIRKISWNYIRRKTLSGKTTEIIGFGMDITEWSKTQDRLKDRSADLERMNRLMIDRELRMVELKKEIEELKKSRLQNHDA